MPSGVPSTGDASKPRNSTSGWNGSAIVSLKLTALTCCSSAPSTLAAPLRVKSLDFKVWMLPGTLSLSTLKPGTGVMPMTTISLRFCVPCGACCATTMEEIAVKVVASTQEESRSGIAITLIRFTGKSPRVFYVEREVSTNAQHSTREKIPGNPGSFSRFSRRTASRAARRRNGGLRETQHRSPQGYCAGGGNPRQTDVLLEQ